ncbi:MAG: hypothetical protein ABIA47_02920 [bacterium]
MNRFFVLLLGLLMLSLEAFAGKRYYNSVLYIEGDISGDSIAQAVDSKLLQGSPSLESCLTDADRSSVWIGVSGKSGKQRKMSLQSNNPFAHSDCVEGLLRKIKFPLTADGSDYSFKIEWRRGMTTVGPPSN